jgi:hypothetical protein
MRSAARTSFASARASNDTIVSFLDQDDLGHSSGEWSAAYVRDAVLRSSYRKSRHSKEDAGLAHQMPHKKRTDEVAAQPAHLPSMSSA